MATEAVSPNKRSDGALSAVTCIAPTGPNLPLVIDSPHSGRYYPPEFHYGVSLESLQRMEDGFVDQLLKDVPNHGATLLTANFARAFIDTNRAEDDIDVGMLDGGWPNPVNPTHKSAIGVGLVFKRNLEGAPIHTRTLTTNELLGRIETYYRPYHHALRQALDATHKQFGFVLHLNCHSMPTFALGAKSTRRPDFCLGDRYGRTCAPAFTELAASTLRAMGFRVAINDPYAGAELVSRYGAPTQGRHSLQIEINRALYMDEQAHRLHIGATRIADSIIKLIEALGAQYKNHALAAE
ncbi:MAG: N-formylglutamate amidohydrolase [Chromatiales bacterium]|jgi:N-formylglutamate deformylase|nr:N-formylglutamate amidohydrolase [Chromatiales bacterium]